MAENRTWAIGDRIVYQFTDLEGAHSVPGTVAGLLVIGEENFIRITWDDGDDDSVWEANDRDVSPLLELGASEIVAQESEILIYAVVNGEKEDEDSEGNLFSSVSDEGAVNGIFTDLAAAQAFAEKFDNAHRDKDIKIHGWVANHPERGSKTFPFKRWYSQISA